jgi:hypothetical protein
MDNMKDVLVYGDLLHELVSEHSWSDTQFYAHLSIRLDFSGKRAG